MHRKLFLSFLLSVAISSFDSSRAAPTLTPGTWVNITPAQLDPATYACTDLKFDPSNPSTLFAVFGSATGIYRSTDGGATWAVYGDMPSPVGLGRICIDPRNAAHLYFLGGLGTVTNGFWASTDGGAHWVASAAFKAGVAVTTNDMYNLVMDPADGNHLIMTSHQPWNGYGEDAGVLETKDGGATFIQHAPPSGMSHGTGIAFLYDPVKGIGNSNTWLVGSGYADGLWRTTDAGTTWQEVSTTYSGDHGGFEAYISKNGNVYIGALGGIARSSDVGATWVQAPNGLPWSYYYCAIGDGNHLYTSAGFVGADQNQPTFVSPEGGANEGAAWTTYSSQTLGNGPWRMVFDATNRIIYSANWGTGAMALRVIDPATAVQRGTSAKTTAAPMARSAVKMVGAGLVVQNNHSAGIRPSFGCNIRGMLINVK
jgi:photosystem II stability/assembly factor-like uncharacterized protein